MAADGSPPAEEGFSNGGVSSPPPTLPALKRYSAGELEALRYAVAPELQDALWSEVYARLGPAVVREYETLREEEPERKKRAGGRARGRGSGRGRGKWFDEVPQKSGLLLTDGASVNDQSDNYGANMHDDLLNNAESTEYEEDDSDNEYDTILRPAFFVEGEPDFDSGPPLDGFEYIRRVRWEAARIPQVTLASINLNEIRSEQTPYIPNIPDIPKCPPNLLPSKQWEDAFLAEFAELREAFVQLDVSHPELVAARETPSNLKLTSCSELQVWPMLTTIAGTDAVHRAATLRNYIDMVEDLSSLSQEHCTWLFALCVAVDAPLHAETSASLRSLLRKCSGILAAKKDVDDEVAMLNILITISGKYFRQNEGLVSTPCI